MEWLTRWWRELARDVVLTGAGLWVIYKQVFAAHPSGWLILAGIALISPATAVNLVRAFSGTGGSSSPSSPPPGPAPLSLTSGDTDHDD